MLNMSLNGIPSNSGLSNKKRGKMVCASTANRFSSSSEFKPNSKLKRHKTLESTIGKRSFSGSSSPRDGSVNKSSEGKRKKNKNNSTNSSRATTSKPAPRSIPRPAPRPIPRPTPNLDPRSAPRSNSRSAPMTASSNTPAQLSSLIHSINSSANLISSTHSRNKRRLDGSTPTVNRNYINNNNNNSMVNANDSSTRVIPTANSSPLLAILTLLEKKKKRKMEAKSTIGKRRFLADSVTVNLSPPPSLHPRHVERFNRKKQKMVDMQQVLGKRSFSGSNDFASPSIPTPGVFFSRNKKNRCNSSKTSCISSMSNASIPQSFNTSTSSSNPSDDVLSINALSTSNDIIESNDDLDDRSNPSHPLPSPTPNLNLHTSSSPLASLNGEFNSQSQNQNQLQPIPYSDGEDEDEFEVRGGLYFETDLEAGNETEKEKETEEFEIFYDALDEFAREDEAAGEIDSEIFMDALDYCYV